MSAPAPEPSAPPRPQSILAYVRLLREVMPGRALLTLCLMLVGSLTQWTGLMMLVPLLTLVGLDVGSGPAGRISEAATAIITGVGLQPSLPMVLLLFVAVTLVTELLGRWQSLCVVELQEGLVLYLRQRLYRAVTHARWLYYARRRASDFVHILSGQAASAGHATLFLLTLVSSVLTSLIYVVVALKLSPSMTLLALACGSGLFLLMRRRVRKTRELGGAMAVSSGRFYGVLSEHLAGMKVAKSYGAEDRNVRIFTQFTDEVAQINRDNSRNELWVGMGYRIGSVLALSVILYMAVERFQLATAEILLLLFVFSRLVPMFSGAQRTYQNLVFALPALFQVRDAIDECEREAEPSSERVRSVVFEEAIRLEDVSFSYAPDLAVETLADVDLRIEARRTTAIVGPSGAGKSTIADLVMGLLTPTFGRVLIDGEPLAPDTLRGWRERIGYVPQDTFLFHDTIRANLLWARPDASEAELEEILRLAAADEFVRRMPLGLDTVIGDRGVLLSGGERQRLALARALLRRPALLILDEATSALDSENEKKIQQAIERLHGQMTILIITHRLSTIRQSDRIFVVENGRLVETGEWRSLLARGRRFADLCRAQGIPIEPDYEAAPEGAAAGV